MRLLFPVAIALAALGSAGPAKLPPLQKAGADCPSATTQFTRRGGIWTHDPAKPKKLTELPPADSYAAVYRLDERGCMVPVKYREVRR